MECGNAHVDLTKLLVDSLVSAFDYPHGRERQGSENDDVPRLVGHDDLTIIGQQAP